MTSEFFDAGLPIEMGGFGSTVGQAVPEIDAAPTLETALEQAGLLRQASAERGDLLERHGATSAEQDWAVRPGSESSARAVLS